MAVVAGESDAYIVRTRGVEGQVLPRADGAERRITALEHLAAAGFGGVLTGADVTSAWLTEQRDLLPAALRTFESADDVHLALMSKKSGSHIAREAGVAVPWTRPATTLAELEVAVHEAPYPAVLKPVFSHAWRAIFGDDRVLLVHSEAEARRAGERGLEAGLQMMMSEYVPGGDANVEEAIVVRAPDGSYPVYFGCAKIRQFPVGFGAASLCEIAELPETMELARAVLDRAGFVGVANVEFKRHAATGERYFLEVNVRIPTHFGLGDAAGLDAARRMAAVLTGEVVGPQPPMARNARLLFPQMEVRAALAAVRKAAPRERAAVAGGLLRSYAGVREFGIFDPRDPRPGLTLVGAALGRRVRGRLRTGTAWQSPTRPRAAPGPGT